MSLKSGQDDVRWVWVAGTAIAGVLVTILPWTLKGIGILVIAALAYRYINQALKSAAVRIVFIYVAISLVSGVINDTEAIVIAKYAFISFGFLAISSVAHSHQIERQSAVLGLVFACAIYCLFFAFSSEWGRLNDPDSRGDADYDVFLAQTAAVLAVVSLRLVLTESFGRRWALIFVILFCLGAIYPYLIKSRGYSGVLLLSIAYIAFRYGRSTLLLWVAGIVTLILVMFSEQVVIFWNRVAEVYGLFDGLRDVTTGTGRFRAWEYALLDIFPERPWLGFGPDSNYELIWSGTLIRGAHNVLIGTLVDTGIVGFAALLSLLLVVSVRAVRNDDNWVGVHVALIGAGSVLNENLLFSFGNPGSLLVLLSLAILSRRIESPLVHESNPRESQGLRQGERGLNRG